MIPCLHLLLIPPITIIQLQRGAKRSAGPPSSVYHSPVFTTLLIALRNQIPARYIRGFYLCRYTLYPRLVRSTLPLRVLQSPYLLAGTNPENWENVLEYSPVLDWQAHCKHSFRYHIQTKTNSSSFSGVLQAAVYQ